MGDRKSGCWLVLVEFELDFDIVGLARKTVGERRDLRYFLCRAHHRFVHHRVARRGRNLAENDRAVLADPDFEDGDEVLI